ncbi:TlpA family protein disulfide reductase [Algibacter amylolyticus]|uniref:TlpA family protein disulfide reductase n=1 Tax=Algibacter amylolyticus TaxID=1608400 RepID=A0A5M7AVZ4_9FLAO|nr:TlpA disulfide reductase family protein [Algibacter amylolyticus]KAA5821449.1 TlpA family protein disulfide reductase [Algibacter amylolyticus]MBB5268325.1 thiol-disulfide isomerase/thioredoxin [Algibacter amylolyticus]TSJ72961.1 TlpA family protein disulfide reductase [Algibacter amylolyticus]
MKKLLLIALAISVFNCKKEIKTATENHAIISGKITNKQPGELTINSEDRTFSAPIKVAADGTFTDTLSTDIKSYVLYDGKNPVFLNLAPGFNLNITYDATNFDNTIAISGNGSKINNYFVAKRKAEMELAKKSAEIFVLDEASYKAKMLEFKNTQKNILSNAKDLPSDFISKEKRSINYGYLSSLSNFERAHQYFTKNNDFKVSEDFLNDLDGMDFSNAEDFEFSSHYKGIVNDHYASKARELQTKDSIAYDLAFLKTVSAVESEPIKNTLLFEFVNFNLTYSNDVDALYNTFLKNSTNEKNNTTVTEKYNKLTALKKGKPSPKFTNYENHSGGKTSLEDLKGKYVYIDVWATWCGPCIQQIPHLQKIEKQYFGKNIEFVSISIDKDRDYEKWKTMVVEKDLGGIQLFADSDWTSAFIQDYQIQGIPKFILVDPQGNIVDANAPRPSSPQLIELFNELNI